MQAEDRLTVTLEAIHWNQIMAILAERPYAEVAYLIDTIKAQCMAQSAPAQMVQQVVPPSGIDLRLVPADDSQPDVA